MNRQKEADILDLPAMPYNIYLDCLGHNARPDPMSPFDWIRSRIDQVQIPLWLLQAGDLESVTNPQANG